MDSPYNFPINYPPTFRRAMKLHARSPSFLKRVTDTQSEISKIIVFHPYPQTYIAFSGGKDSMVLLHLAETTTNNKIICYHWDYGSRLIPRKIKTEILQNLKTIMPTARIIIRSRPSQATSRNDPATGYRAFFATLAMLTKERGWTAGLVGFRAEESCTRTRRVEQAGSNGEWHSGQKCRLYYPIRNWSWQDVYAYLITRDLPIPKIYHAHASLVGYERARFVTFFDSEFAALGNSNLDGHMLPEFKQ